MYRFVAACILCLIIKTERVVGLSGFDEEPFEFTRVEPANEIGITTKVIAHIHRPAKSTTEKWTLNREFTPDAVVKALNSTCSENLIDRKLKWANCQLDEDGFTAELTHGRPESKNKTYVYLAMSYKPYQRMENGKRQFCTLAIVDENPVYFLMETFSKVPSNDSFPRTPERSVDAVHVHQLGKFGKEFLSVYGDSIDQDGIYNFDVMDYHERDQLYECFLSIGSSESVSVLDEKCPIYCLEQLNNSELLDELGVEDSDANIYIAKRNLPFTHDDSDSDSDDSDDESDGQEEGNVEEEEEDAEEMGFSYDEDEEPAERTVHIHNEL